MTTHRRTALAGLLSAILALGLALPAQADRDERRTRLVQGAALLAIAGLIVHEARRDGRDDGRHRVARAPVPVPPDAPPPAAGGTDPALPASCLRQVASTGGAVTLYDGDCLDARSPVASDLPLTCGVIVRRPEGGIASGYRPDCLAGQGYEVADRR
ncbi:hypothetical protein [Wenxinia saemankumensis]|uniref:Uncharacterized protein n=1 Tax=Wenxinia saemankumensis TaxID=1447782 RepID=A0A1M6FKA2_9RHOB|nr:hypothetical protein [Wenxinia saemankumensis]SHI98096.1 hypothetical protein SAMN05444417_2364 [Wenxinia saemankumensis]